MQDRQRYLTIILLLIASMLVVVWAEFADDKLAIFVLAILLLAVALINALNGFFLPRTQINPRGLAQQNSQKRFTKSLSNAFSVPFMIVNGSGQIEFVNKAFRQTFTHIRVDDHYSKVARSPNFVAALRAALNGQDVAPFSFETYRSGDRVFTARIARLKPARIGSADDEILVEIFDHTKERRSDMMRRDFIANASHELRTPLAAILGGLETIRENDDMETVDHFEPIMRKEAERMQRLISDLMSLSKIELNEHYTPEDDVNLRQVLDDSLLALDTRGALSGAKIENHVERDVWVKGDVDQLQQVITNILDNALTYAGQGAEIEISLKQSDARYPQKIGLAIADNGPGIAAQDISRLTERFYRVSKTESLNKGGTGLGLAIVKHMLRRHRGELQIVSQLGEGSEFTIWLPELIVD